MEQFYNKHYVRLDTNNCIINGFSDAFATLLDTDICINQEGGRQFELLGQVNPSLTDIKGVHLYKYVGGEVLETTAEEQQEERDNIPKMTTQADEQAEYFIDLDFRLSLLELGV